MEGIGLFGGIFFVVGGIVLTKMGKGPIGIVAIIFGVGGIIYGVGDFFGKLFGGA